MTVRAQPGQDEPTDGSAHAVLLGGAEHTYCTVRCPVPWEEGLASWRQRAGGALDDLESEGRMLARNAAVEDQLRKLDALAKMPPSARRGEEL